PVEEVLIFNDFDLEFPRNITIHGWNKKNNKKYPQFKDRYSYLFNLDDVIEKGNFNKYMESTIKLEPVIDLYLDLIYSQEMNVTQAFLNITQALETYHSRFIFSGKISQYKRRVDEIILKEVPEINKKHYREFLLANSKKFITLQSRIAELLLANFQFRFYTGEIPFFDFPKSVVARRNYYTHYDE